MFKPIETQECWLIQNVKTGNIVLAYRTESGNEKKALFPTKENALAILKAKIPNSEDYQICRVKKGRNKENG